MSIRGVKVTTDKRLSWVELDGLESYQACVGGYIEALEQPDRCDVWINEEGKIHGLPFNSIATDVALRMLMPGDSVRGDVVITGPCDRNGESTSLSMETATFRLLAKVADEAGGEWLLRLVRDEDCPRCGHPETWADATEKQGPILLGCNWCEWRQALDTAALGE